MDRKHISYRYRDHQLLIFGSKCINESWSSEGCPRPVLNITWKQTANLWWHHTMCDLSICNKPLISFFHQEWGYILSTGMGCIEREVRGLALKEQTLWTSIVTSDRLTGKSYRQECTVWTQLWDPALLNRTNDEKESPMLCFWLMIMLAMQECDSSCSVSCSSPKYKAITSATWFNPQSMQIEESSCPPEAWSIPSSRSTGSPHDPNEADANLP